MILDQLPEHNADKMSPAKEHYPNLSKSIKFLNN